MNFTLKQIISIIIAMVGAVGIVLLVVCAEMFKTFAYESEESALSETVGIKVTDLLKELERRSKEMGGYLQQDPQMRAAASSHDRPVITSLLNDQFFQYYTTAGILRIARLYVFDLEFNLLGHSTEGYVHLPDNLVLCASTIENAKHRAGAERVKSITDTCTYEGVGYFSVLTPMGGLIPTGYIMVVTDPAFSLKETERDIGNPIQIRHPSGAISYQSQAWPTDAQRDNFINARHVLKNHRSEEVLTVSIARDIKVFSEKLTHTIWLALGLSVGIIIPIILVTVFLMRKALKPLDDLVSASDDIGRGKQVRIASSSFPEINTVVHSFNQMSQDIHRLVEDIQQANRAKSAFLANMSHEIRTPLAAVIGYTEQLLDENLTREEHNGHVATVIRNSKHLLSIINDILDLSKIEANKVEVEIIRVSPLEVMREVEAVLGPLAREKGLEFRTQAVFPLPQQIDSDPTRLKQVLLNVSGNAIKFTETGSIIITCSFDAPRSAIVFTFLDTGIGMGEEALSRIFRPFSQADVSTTRKFGGTGLGLTISKQLANLLGGDLVCTSQLGKGTTFTLTIATGHVDSDHLLYSEPKAPAAKSAASAAQALRVKGRVLLAEDNPDIQRLVQTYLRRTGAEVAAVENGQLAVERAMAEHFDLVFMDMQMPIMDGVEATKTLRSLGYERAIVALTANAMKEDRERYHAAGVNDFLAKPVDLAAFYAVVGNYLAKVEPRQNVVAGVVDGDANVAELVILFKRGLPRIMQEFRDALERNDANALRQVAHKLKGAGGSYGFPQLTELSANIEALAKECQLVAARPLVANLATLCHEINAA